jgi:hypothetical protein
MTTKLEPSVKVTVMIWTDNMYDNPHVKQQQVIFYQQNRLQSPVFLETIVQSTLGHKTAIHVKNASGRRNSPTILSV